MRQRVAIVGFFIIVLVVIAGCLSPAPSGTSSSAPPASALSLVSPAQPVSHDINSVQTFSRDGTSLAVSIDRIISIPGHSYNYFSWLAVDYTITNMGKDPFRIQFIDAGFVTDTYPHELKQCSDERTCNTTDIYIGFTRYNPEGSVNKDESGMLYPGVPLKVTSNTSFDKTDYENLKQGMTISFYRFCTYSVSWEYRGCYEGWNAGLPSWKIDFAKDITMLPAR